MYEYKIENFYLSPKRESNAGSLKCDVNDFAAMIAENAKKGWRYIEHFKPSGHFTLCLLVFERKIEPSTPAPTQTEAKAAQS